MQDQLGGLVNELAADVLLIVVDALAPSVAVGREHRMPRAFRWPHRRAERLRETQNVFERERQAVNDRRHGGDSFPVGKPYGLSAGTGMPIVDTGRIAPLQSLWGFPMGSTFHRRNRRELLSECQY